MSAIISFLNERHERTVTIFGVMFVAMGLFAPPSGIVPVLIATYSLNVEMWAILIIAGMFVKALSGGHIGLRLLGVAPYTAFVVLAASLWWRGITGLLQSQILYVVIWLILCDPLLRDVVKWGRAKYNHDDTKTI